MISRFFIDRPIFAAVLSIVITLAGLLELPDGQLLDLVLGRVEPQGALDRAPVHELLARLRAA